MDKAFMDGVSKLREQNPNLPKTLMVPKILNWYRNLYFRESESTERGLIANILNAFFVDLKGLGVDLESMTLTDGHKSAVLQGLENMKIFDGHGDGLQYMDGDVAYTVNEMITEITNGTEVGRKFEQQVYDLTLTYMGKFTQNGE